MFASQNHLRIGGGNTFLIACLINLESREITKTVTVGLLKSLTFYEEKHVINLIFLTQHSKIMYFKCGVFTYFEVYSS